MLEKNIEQERLKNRIKAYGPDGYRKPDPLVGKIQG